MIEAVETIARFGPSESLVGIFARPAHAPTRGTPAIVIPNTGIAHRGSHHRLFVIFARALALAGYPVLRFDLSGLGDSLSRGASVDRVDAERADLQAAIDWVEAAGHGEVVLLGLCSGADRSVAYAGQDKRVRGVILIDPTVPPTFRHLGTLLRERLVQVASRGVTVFVQGLAARWARKGRNLPPRAERRGAGPAAWLAWYKVPRFLEAAYASSIANGQAMLVIVTSGMRDRHSYAEHLPEAFPRIDFREQLSVRKLDGVHHLLVLESERQLAIDVMCEWLSRQRKPARQAASLGQ